MSEAVCDSSTLILLAKTGLLKHVFSYANKVLISQEVFNEVVAEGKKAKKEDALTVEKEVKDGRITVLNIKQKTFVEGLLTDFRMDRGEAESIALCLERKALFLGTDDSEAIKACRVYGIPFITALSFTVMLSKEKVIEKQEAKLAIEKLERIGFYSREIIDEAKKESDLYGTSR